MANVFSPLKILIVYLNSPEITAILAYFGLNLVVMVIPSDLLKILISYFDFSTPKTYYSRERCHDIMYRNETSAILSYFSPNMVAMATLFPPLKILTAYLYPPTPETLPFTQSVSIFCTELKSVQFWIIFAHISLPWQLPLLP